MIDHLEVGLRLTMACSSGVGVDGAHRALIERCGARIAHPSFVDARDMEGAMTP